MRGSLVFHRQRNMTNMAHNIDVQRHDTGNTVEENMQETKVNVQTTMQPARNARKWITKLECKQISKPRGDCNVNKINASDSEEEYGEEEYNEENYSEEDSDAYTCRLTHELRAVKDKGTQWFVALNLKANDHSRDVKCPIDTGTTCNVMNYMTSVLQNVS